MTAGFLLGSTHDDTSIAGVIPNEWIEWAVGGNSLLSNFFASFTGVFMYFAALTEVPIIQGLLASGMGKGPALALLLAGPSLSLPNMLVIQGVMGTKKTIVYVALVIIMATISGLYSEISFKFPVYIVKQTRTKLLLVSVLCIQIIALYLYSERVI